MYDRGFFLTVDAIRRQLAAMPNELYLVRLIHHQSRRAFPGERLWTARQLINANTVGFLRARNREGCDIYIHPFAGDRNAGYILVDLDVAGPAVLESMRADGHAPCVVLQTSPGHLQAWIRLSVDPLDPAVATAVGQQLARGYGGDLASTDWRHLGRLAGFTNQKPARRTLSGYAPWVRIIHAHASMATAAETLLQSARAAMAQASRAASPAAAGRARTPSTLGDQAAFLTISAADAIQIYHRCMQRWRIIERFPQPDWSIVDLWVAKHLLTQGTPAAQVKDILRLASPHFPRCHGDPDDYLRRTLARAVFPP